jgi:hypothetical protein
MKDVIFYQSNGEVDDFAVGSLLLQTTPGEDKNNVSSLVNFMSAGQDMTKGLPD